MTPELDRRNFLKLVGVTAIVASCGGASTASPAPSTGGTAKATGRISIYSALNESTNNQLFAAFTQATGVQVDVLPLAAAGELQTRITAEKASPKADIFVGGSSEFHDPLGKQGLLEPYKSPKASALKAEFKEASGNWTGWYTGIFGMVTNSGEMTKAGLKAPTSWDDLLDAKWKGSLVKGTKNLAGAQAFVVWGLTPEAGALNVKLSNRGSTLEGVASAPGAPTLAQVKLVNYDRQWATDNKDRILKLWQQAVGIQ